MTKITLHPGDNRASLRRLIDEGVRVHSVVTDPPYGLVSIQKRFGKEGAKAARTEKNDGSFARLSGGFMGKAWDGSGIERDPEFWALIYEILLPGGYVFAFSGSRTGHWQACAMEMAGFIMHPMHGWVFGSGFPKNTNPCPQIDRIMGVEGGRGAPKPGHEGHMGKDNLRSLRESGTMSQEGGFSRPWMSDPDKIEDSHYRYGPGSPEAQAWDGWSYGTQAQKPAIEPIYLGQKPFDCKTGAANLLKHGVGAVNIDACRVGEQGRHPSNLILDGSPDVVAMFPGQNAEFFHQFGPDADPLIYQPKAGKLDRAGSKHPTVKPIALMQYLVRHITPPSGVVLDPFAGSGTTAEAARREGFDCIMMEAEAEYLDFLHDRFEIANPSAPIIPAFDFDDILGEAMPDHSTPCGTDHLFGDLL